MSSQLAKIKRNISLLNAVADFLEEHLEKHRQSTWLAAEDTYAHPRTGRETQFFADIYFWDAKYAQDCGTVGCVAGWAWTIASPQKRAAVLRGFYDGGSFSDWGEAGQAVLGLTNDEALWLFHQSRRRKTMPKVLRALAAEMSLQEVKKAVPRA